MNKVAKKIVSSFSVSKVLFGGCGLLFTPEELFSYGLSIKADLTQGKTGAQASSSGEATTTTGMHGESKYGNAGVNAQQQSEQVSEHKIFAVENDSATAATAGKPARETETVDPETAWTPTVIFSENETPVKRVIELTVSVERGSNGVDGKPVLKVEKEGTAVEYFADVSSEYFGRFSSEWIQNLELDDAPEKIVPTHLIQELTVAIRKSNPDLQGPVLSFVSRKGRLLGKSEEEAMTTTGMHGILYNKKYNI